MSRYRASLQVGKQHRTQIGRTVNRGSPRRPYAREVLDSASDSADALATECTRPGHCQANRDGDGLPGRPAGCKRPDRD
jgi:hypothetical protein